MVNPFGAQSLPSFPCHLWNLVCKSGNGLTEHQQTVHHEFTPTSEDDADNLLFTSQTHPLLNSEIHSSHLETWLTFQKLYPVTRMAFIYRCILLLMHLRKIHHQTLGPHLNHEQNLISLCRGTEFSGQYL